MTSLEGQVALITGSSRGIGAALATTADLTSFDQIEAMRRQIEDHAGPVDILVANAGGSPAAQLRLTGRLFRNQGPIELLTKDVAGGSVLV